jgi:hypothetical protein
VARATIALTWTFAGIVAATMIAGAWAQATMSDRDRTPKTETEGQAPPAEDLSERLDRSKGVIRPPRGVDPEMQIPPPPGSGKTPVIPPPGSPGGDQAIEPK